MTAKCFHQHPSASSPNHISHLYPHGSHTASIRFNLRRLTDNVKFPFVGGYVLPVIADPVTGQQECRLSSDTYIATEDVPPLSIIQVLFMLKLLALLIASAKY